MIVVASNLHGNAIALRKLLEEVERLREEGKDIKGVFVLGVFGYMPFPRETMNLIVEKGISVTRGWHDHLIAKWRDMSEDEKEEIPELDRLVVEWNRERLGKEGRSWIRNDVPAFLSRRFGDNEFLFTYGSPFDPINGRVLPNQPSTYYDQFLSPLKEYEMLVVGGYEPFVAETKHGKVVCPGSCGIYPKPTFVLIDTRGLDVSFYEFEFDRGMVERRIKEENLPDDLMRILHHGV